MQVNITASLLALIAALNLWIGMYVYRREPGAGQNRAFAFMAAAISLWTTALMFTHYGSVAPTWNLRLAFAAASLFVYGGLSFIQCLPFSSVVPFKLKGWLSASSTSLLCALSFSPWIVISVSSESEGLQTTYGPLHPLFAVYFLLYFIYCVLVLALAHRASTGLLKVQIRYFLFAFAIPSSLAVITNLVVPLLLGTSTLSKYGPFFSLLFVALIGHAIIRHRLMDMRVVIKRSVVYLAAFTAAGLILITLLVTSNLI
ncbi:MAG TPA: histidine kinase N-terminal 7TM domain-containing protein, partial [Blastocatellia bacterium]|nr:histidine kinase N-terminal 7TM domain-containing protein [Blastocatellia bacterium]